MMTMMRNMTTRVACFIPPPCILSFFSPVPNVYPLLLSLLLLFFFSSLYIYTASSQCTGRVRLLSLISFLSHTFNVCADNVEHSPGSFFFLSLSLFVFLLPFSRCPLFFHESGDSLIGFSFSLSYPRMYVCGYTAWR